MTGIEISSTNVPEPGSLSVFLENALMIGGVLIAFAAALLLVSALALREPVFAAVGVVVAFASLGALVGGGLAAGPGHEYREAVEQALAETVAALEDHYDIDFTSSPIDLSSDALQTLLVTDTRTGAPVTLISSKDEDRITLFSQGGRQPSTEFRAAD